MVLGLVYQREYAMRRLIIATLLAGAMLAVRPARAAVIISTGNDGVGALEHVPVADTGLVPEPSTWLSMFAGFAALGLAMRRRRNVTVNFA